ncbi:hypothetical protein INR49_007379 [Caranx melampygus]|nr:hypothetical protein INR49_007379 [Caranx melampygus]
MWACALGHQRAAELLYSWNGLALGIPDSLGRLPLAVARSRGHTRLATALEELHTHSTHTHTRRPGTHTRRSPAPTVPSVHQPRHWSQLLQQPPLTQRPVLPLPSSAYSSGPAPMDTSPPLPSLLPPPPPLPPRCLSPALCLLPVPPFPPPVAMWGGGPDAGFSTGLNPRGSTDSPLYLMDYESSAHSHTHSYTHTPAVRGAHAAATLEEQLLSYSENAENEGGEEST